MVNRGGVEPRAHGLKVRCPADPGLKAPGPLNERREPRFSARLMIVSYDWSTCTVSIRVLAVIGRAS